jgi:hypothetical protein
LDLNHPPTAVGGIRKFVTSLLCRSDLNNPPTAVGGISEFSHSLGSQWIPALNSNIEVIDTLKEKLYRGSQFRTGPLLVFSDFGPGKTLNERRTQNMIKGGEPPVKKAKKKAASKKAAKKKAATKKAAKK